MLATVINVIIVLNLLVSILGNSYDKFTTEAEEIGNREMADLVIEIETMMFWKRNQSKKQYLQVCDETKSEKLSDNWGGKMKAIQNCVDKIMVNSKKDFQAIMSQLDDMEK